MVLPTNEAETASRDCKVGAEKRFRRRLQRGDDMLKCVEGNWTWVIHEDQDVTVLSPWPKDQVHGMELGALFISMMNNLQVNLMA